MSSRQANDIVPLKVHSLLTCEGPHVRTQWRSHNCFLCLFSQLAAGRAGSCVWAACPPPWGHSRYTWLVGSLPVVALSSQNLATLHSLYATWTPCSCAALIYFPCVTQSRCNRHTEVPCSSFRISFSFIRLSCKNSSCMVGSCRANASIRSSKKGSGFLGTCAAIPAPQFPMVPEFTS